MHLAGLRICVALHRDAHFIPRFFSMLSTPPYRMFGHLLPLLVCIVMPVHPVVLAGVRFADFRLVLLAQVITDLPAFHDVVSIPLVLRLVFLDIFRL